MTQLPPPRKMGGLFKPSFGLSGVVADPTLRCVIRSEAEGSAVPRTIPGNVFRQCVAQWGDLR
jgi:hypothetical protein